jgi:nitrate reductase gamma subunit
MPAYGICRHVKKMLAGKTTALPWNRIRGSLTNAVAEILLNRTIARRHRLAGLMHFAVMWGFITLFIGTVLISIEYDIFQKLLGRSHGFWVGSFFLGYELVLDTMGAIFLIGLVIALIRRYLLKRPQLTWKPLDLLLPVWLLLIGLTGFWVEGMRLAATRAELGYSPYWSPIGWMVSSIWSGVAPSTIRAWHWYTWWFHGVLALGWVAALPYGPKVMHVLTAALNILLRDLRPRGRLAPVDVEAAFEGNQPLGFDTIADLSRKDLLDLASCTECGRCEMAARMLRQAPSPRQIVVKLRDQADGRRYSSVVEERHSIMGVDPPEEIWAHDLHGLCRGCRIHIDPLSKILELRRNQVMIRISILIPCGYFLRHKEAGIPGTSILRAA